MMINSHYSIEIEVTEIGSVNMHMTSVYAGDYHTQTIGYSNWRHAMSELERLLPFTSRDIVVRVSVSR